MPRILTISLLAVVLPLALILGLLLAIPYLVTLDSFGPKVAEKLEPALGRHIHMGHIHLSVLPLSLIVDKVGITEDPAFGTGDFATMDKLKIDLSLVALFNQRVDVTTLEADKPWAKIIKNANGDWNIDSLGPEAADKNAPAKSPGAAASTPVLEIAKLRLIDGSFSLDDASGPAPLHQEFKQVTASAEHLASGKAFDFLLSLKIGDGTMETSGTAGPFSAAIPPSLPMQGHVRLDNVDIVKLYGPDAPIHGVVTGTFEIDYNGQIAKLTGPGHPGPEQGQVTIQQLQTSAKGKPASIPVIVNFQGEYMPLTENLSLSNVDINAGQATMALSAVTNRRLPQSNHLSLKTTNAALADFGKLLTPMGVTLPNNSSFTAGSLTQSAEFSGGLQPLNGTVTIDVHNAKWSGYSVTEKVSGVARLAGLQTTRDTDIQSLKGNANFVNGAATFSNLELVMPGLTVNGGGTMDAEGQLDLKMQAFFTGGSTGAKVIAALAGSKGVPFSVKGPMNNPQFSADVAGAGKQQITSLKDLAGKGGGSLGRALGGLIKKKN